MEPMELEAKVIRSSKRVFSCRIISTQEIISATALGKLLRNSNIVVGDIVSVCKNIQNEYEIFSVKDRKNEIYRMIIRENKKKVMASNIDLMIIVMSATKPKFKRGLLDRYLLRAVQWKIPAVVIFNKMDEFDDHFDILFEEDRLLKLEADCYEVSSTEEDYGNSFLKLGLSELKEVLANKTAIFIGQSGVGKSKLISRLSNGDINLLSKDLAKGIGKGAHTTTWSEIISFEDFDLIDSPGIRAMSIDDLIPEQLRELFIDLEEYFNNCQFHDCPHNDNSKGCSFHQLDPEKRKDKLVLSRLDAYDRFMSELSGNHTWGR
jgi:ribosome biogenesis GTPase